MPLDVLKERRRAARRTRLLQELADDSVHACRTFARAPGFSGVVVLTLALGIGANTAIFSVVNGVLLKPLPYRQPARLVSLTETLPASASDDGRERRSGAVSGAELVELHARVKSLAQVGMSGGPALMTLSGRGESRRLQGMRIGPGVFETLGVPPRLGRGFDAAEHAPGAAGAILLGNDVWRDVFGADARILGQTLRLANSLARSPEPPREYVVVGVMPHGFEFPDAQIQFWIAATSTPSARGSLVARLSDGVSLASAQAEAGALLHELRKTPPTASYRLERWGGSSVAAVKPALLMLCVATALVLLIACVNVANLLFARAAARQREVAIRLALGAGRGRLVRQLLTESLLLALAGGLCGTALAFAGLGLFKTLARTFARMDLGVQLAFPRLDQVGVDGSVLAYVLLLSLLTALLCGLAPALRGTQQRRSEALRERDTSGGAGLSLGRRGQARSLLVAGEIAMAMMLLIGAGLLVKSFVKLTSVELGFDPGRVLTFQVALPGERYPAPRLRAFADEALERLAAIPGVRAAASGQLPMVAIKESAWFRRTPTVPPRPAPGGPELRLVSPGYLDVMGIRVARGRGLRPEDGPGRPRVLLINETLARQEFPREDPIGQSVFAGRDALPWLIAGVVADVRQASVDREAEPQVFAPLAQWPEAGVFPLGPYFSLRTHADPLAVVAAVREAVRGLDPEAGLFNVASMQEIVTNRVARPRLYAVLVAGFAAIALALALVGIYGVMSYAVAQRTREIGIRIALGARRGQVVGLVLRHSTAVTLAGVLLGAAGAAALSRSLQGLLFGLAPLDPATFLAVPATFAAVATLAAYVPARRAAGMDPAVTLRDE